MGRKKILAVDDNAVNLAALEQTLQADYDVVPVSNGRRALRYLGTQSADLVLLDVRMPGMDGVQTLRELRGLENGASVPVMFLTAADDPDAATEGARLGIIDYVRKPFDSDELKRKIAHVWDEI